MRLLEIQDEAGQVSLNEPTDKKGQVHVTNSFSPHIQVSRSKTPKGINN